MRGALSGGEVLAVGAALSGAQALDRAAAAMVRTNRTEHGQATVEFALLLPILVLLLMCVVQTALIARDAVLVSHAARVGARIAAVDPSGDAVRNAVVEATPLDPSRLQITRRTEGDLVRVTVRYEAPTDVPLVGTLVGDVHMSESVAMWSELPAATHGASGE